tara:strand:+ start:627 stop:797 length:171 start_codon:yes stop_codon:yes gene_type:complete
MLYKKTFLGKNFIKNTLKNLFRKYFCGNPSKSNISSVLFSKKYALSKKPFFFFIKI